MKLTDKHIRSDPFRAGYDKSRHHAVKMVPKVKVKQTEDGRTVRLKRVRRKKKLPSASTETAKPNKLQGTDRVVGTSELGKPAPVQSKPNAVAPKIARPRSITPGLSGLVKKATPPWKSPFTSVETVL